MEHIITLNQVTIELDSELSPNMEIQYFSYRGMRLPLLLKKRTIRPGRRQVWLKYNSNANQFYLTDGPTTRRVNK